MNVLVISCHPDDMEINCAGTLIKCVKRGDKVTVCHVSNGDMGHMVIMPPELRKIRIEEARRSGAMVGIKVITADVGDLLPNGCDIEQRNKLVNIIREEDPDLIITHAPNDYMLDHRAVSKLAFDASFAASCPHYLNGKAAKITPLYYMDNLNGLGFTPTEFVDISDEIDTKIKMLECHESQIKWMKDHDGVDFAEETRAAARYRGLQCGVKYAEAFTQEYVNLRVVPRRLLP